MKKNNNLKTQPATQCRLVESFWTFWPAFQRWADSQCKQTNLSPQRVRILALLSEKGPQIMSALRDELGVTATNITALVDALERDGLVHRKAHPDDRRATIIEVSPKASHELGQGCLAFRERVGKLFSSLTEAERKELLRMMDILHTELENETTRRHDGEKLNENP